jgi:hypothetical protein
MTKSYQITVYYTHGNEEKYVSLSVVSDNERFDIKEFIDGIFDGGMELNYNGLNQFVEPEKINEIDCQELSKEETEQLNKLLTVCCN